MELQRLQRNKERREARERQGKKNSFGGDVMSPEATTPGSPMISTPAPGKTVTTRKCANCGQAGHIRMFFRGAHGFLTDSVSGTNKKLCPKLNGQWAELGMSPPAPAGTPTGS